MVADFPAWSGREGKLSRWYIFSVLYAERDKEGRVVQPRGDAPRESLADRYRRIAVGRGVPAHRLDAKVREMLEANRRFRGGRNG